MLGAWIPETVEIDYVVQKRSPYYHKIDTAGNQLPYIDELRSALAGNPELVAAKVISGQSDYGAGIWGGGVSINKLPLLLSRAVARNRTTCACRWRLPSRAGPPSTSACFSTTPIPIR